MSQISCSTKRPSHNKFLQTFFENGNQPLPTGIIETMGTDRNTCSPSPDFPNYTPINKMAFTPCEALKIAQNLGRRLCRSRNYSFRDRYGCAITEQLAIRKRCRELRQPSHHEGCCSIGNDAVWTRADESFHRNELDLSLEPLE